MAIIKTDAILLKKTQLRETSLIIDFFTEESGKIKGVLKGVRCPEPQFGALYEVFTLDRIVFYEKKNKDLFIISQCELIDFFPELRESLEKLGYASYFTELIDLAVESGEKNKAIFKLLLDSLRILSEPGSAKRLTRVFEIKLLKELGLMPGLKSCVSCGKEVATGKAGFSIIGGGILCRDCFKSDPKVRPILAGTLNFIEHVSVTPMDKISRIKVSTDVGRELERVMADFLSFHINRKFKSIEFLQEVGAL
ncbi:MAG: DNA repair protein RecO [Candidatus Omnitrophica bacterium]|nr:DNA repair protein RecO [Candidatus Omnitrophota bacterium]